MEIKGVTESIVHHLRDQIITGELLAGARLNEMELAKRLKVSRAPLREAFRVLEHDHLIVRLPRHGSYVAELNTGHLEKVYEARCMIESFAIDVLEARGVKILPKAEQALEDISACSLPPMSDKQAMLNYVTVMADFHVRLIEATENSWVSNFYESITVTLKRYQFICLYIPGLSEKSHQMHARILSSIRKGQYKSAKEYLISHINQTAELIKTRIHQRDQAISKLMDESIPPQDKKLADQDYS